MAGQEDDPFQRRDTRPWFGKTDRRESHRASVAGKVRLVPEGGDPGEWETVNGSLSLNGFFLMPGDVTFELLDQRAEVCLDLLEEGEVTASVIVRTPVGRPGFIFRLDELDFEDARKIARYLDTTGDSSTEQRSTEGSVSGEAPDEPSEPGSDD